MSSSAVIQQLRFELSVPDTPAAHRLPERLSRLYHDQLAAVLAEELSRYPAENLPQQLAQLVVTLPPLPHHRLAQDLPEQFRAALRAALAALPAPTSARQNLTSESLVALAYFLLHGALPWHAAAPGFVPDAALRAALHAQPGALRELLRRIGKAAAVPQRLARQFGEAPLGQLIGLLEPLDAPFIRAYIAQTLATPQRQGAGFIAQAALQVVIYELVLTDLLLHWHVSFHRQVFLEKQLRQLAAHHNLLYEELLHRLLAGLAGRPVPTTLAATLQALQHQAQQASQRPAPAVAPPGTAALPGATEPPAATTYAALVYYLRHGFLPHHARHSFADLAAQLDLVLREGRAAVQQLSRVAGPEAVAYTVAHQFPRAVSQHIVRLLAPGQTRSFLALVAEQLAPAALPTPARLAHEHTAWQHALQHLLTASTPGPVQQWLPPAAGLAGPGAAGTLSQLLLDYLLAGASAQPLQALRQALRHLLRHEAPQLVAMLRPHSGAHLVLRRLAALLDADDLRVLVGSRATRLGPQRGAWAAGIAAALFASPAAASVYTPQAWLREAFLYFHLRPHGQRHPPSSDEAWHWLAAYNQPRRAVYTWLLRRVGQQAGLMQVPFFAWLLGAPSLQNTQGLLAHPGPRRSGRATQPHLAEPAFALSLSAAGSLVGAEIDLRQPPLFRSSWPVLAAKSLAAARFQSLPSGPTLGLPSTFSTWRFAGTQPAVALELLLAYLLKGTVINSAAVARAMFRLVVSQQPAALRAVLRRYGPTQPALWRRLASVATYAELAQLVPAPAGAMTRHRVGQQALAALDALVGAAGAEAPAGLRFLKIAYLCFHFQSPSGGFSLRDAQRLATALRLPWRALTLQIKQYQQRWPALAATAFFSRLWAFTSKTQPRPATLLPGSYRQDALASRTAVAGPGTAPWVNQRIAQPPGPPAAGAHASALAAQQGALYYLLHGQAPWWQPTPPSASALRGTLAGAARQPLTQAFWQRHAPDATVRQRLAALADFSLLHSLTKATGPGRYQRQLLRPAFARLDQLLRAGPGGGQARFHLFLREAYLASTTAPTAGGKLSTIRQLATAAGLSWRGLLHRVGQLVRQVPALAADPFFALLFQQLLGLAAGSSSLLRRKAVATRRPVPAAARPPLPATATTLATLEVLTHYLRTGGLPVAYSDTARSLIAILLQSPDAQVLVGIRPYLRLTTARHRLAAAVPSGAVFLQLLRWLAPGAAYQALARLVRDWLRLQAAGLVRLGTAPADLWVEVLALMPAPLPTHALPAALVQALARGESALAPPRVASKLVPAALQLLRLIQRHKVPMQSYLSELLATQLVQSEESAAPVPASAATPPAASRPRVRPQPLPPALRPEAATYVANAGLVLAWPFFTPLFERLGYVAERQFRGLEQATRAAYLLQFLATGEAQPPEHLLTLNKLLCGLDRALPLLPEPPLTADEQATGESLLSALMARWGAAFKNTSLAGLRETFLQRSGKLVWSDDRVTLTVETKTVDILLDQRPWSIALIKLPWMPLPLYVTWR